MQKRNYSHPEFSKIAINSKDDILNTSGYTAFSLFGDDGVGNDSDLDRVIWGQ